MTSSARISYGSYDEINGSPEKLLDFAANVATDFEAQKGTHIVTYLQKNISVGGEPFSMTKQISKLHGMDYDRDDLSDDQMRRLQKASSILKKIEPTWLLENGLEGDQRIIEELKTLDGLAAKADAKAELGERLTTKFMAGNDRHGPGISMTIDNRPR